MRFWEVAETFEKLEKVSSRLEMMSILAEFFQKVPASDAGISVYLFQGRLAPEFEQLEIGMGEKFVMQAIAKVSGYSREEVEKKYKSSGDLGLVAEEFLKKKKQRSLYAGELSLQKVHYNLSKIAKASGIGSQELKIKLLAELLNSAKPLEAKFITRVPIGNLRLGVGDSTIMDAIAKNLSKEFEGKEKKEFEKIKEALKEKKEEKRKEELERRVRIKIREMIEEKYNIYSDLGAIAEKLKKKGLEGLKEIEIQAGVPIRPSLAERLSSAEEIIKKTGKCAVEAKLDGFRVQVHKNNEKVEVFSRHAENMSQMFPELVQAARNQLNAKNAIVEGEAIAFNEQTGEFYPFQVTIQRKRKYDIKEKAAEFPLKLFLFDIMLKNGKNLMNLPFKERRKILEETLSKGLTIRLTDSIITDNPKMLEKYFEEKIGEGLEGIIAKDLNARYTAGARKFAWIKLKRSYKGELQDTLDLCILGYLKGKGQRAKFGLGALLVGVFDEKSKEFKTIAKIGTGMTEEMLEQLEKMLNKIKVLKKPSNVNSEITPDHWVKPYFVIEVTADEITKSPIHTCAWNGKTGLALRFPRLLKIRQDKKGEECTTVKEVKKMFEMQKRESTGKGEA